MVTIVVTSAGRTLASIDLTPLEYDALRHSRLEDAVRMLMHMDQRGRADPALILDVVHRIAAGGFQVMEMKAVEE